MPISGNEPASIADLALALGNGSGGGSHRERAGEHR